ncbi:hypothetical protein D9Q98_006522 [Chlorella vulgaris]|uniref:Uncharacterized protein n=1 Tax=Chlorella vulgaris TaxID=3077 RepID=A0A9D4TKC2_CHLVU|nr:hypothetical protein D9Q98_006522 [Chlorella vulgaris]
MSFDAQALWWPPFQKLYNQLETLKLEPSAVPADVLRSTLAEYEPWLTRGVAGFLPPSEASRRALDTQPSLSIGSKKLPVEAGLRAAALDVSAMLALDEVQAYILLRRWVAKAGTQALLPAAGGTAGGGAAAGASLSPDQRLEVAQLYSGERLYLLKSVEGLLWEGERVEGGPLLDVIEGTLASLLDANLEDTIFTSLQANLHALAGAATNTARVAAAPLPISLGALSMATLAGRGAGGQGGSAAAATVALAEAVLHAATVERCSLLHILILIYYHPRKQCTPDRFLSLARLFHSCLFSRTQMPRGASAGAAAGGGELSPAQLSVKLATLLLLEMLDVDKALAALAAGQPVDEAAYVFAAPGVKDSVNAELASWWPASAAHSPVLLAWAAVLCLVARSASESSSGTGAAQLAAAQEYIAYADKAHKTDALRTLRDLTTHAGLQPNAAEMFNNIVLSTMSATFCAFEPSKLALPQLELVVQTMANLFRDQTALCDGFWSGDRATDDPLRHFLDDLRSLYPALPAPFYSLLAALSSTAGSAAFANGYLEQLDSLVSMHVLPDPAIEDSGSEGGEVYTRQAVPLPGAHCLVLPDGAAGEVVPLPEGLTSTDSLWTVPAGTDVDQVSLVRWHIALPESTGQRILLARLSDALVVVRHHVPGSPSAPSGAGSHVAAALAEMAAAFQLLASFCINDPHTAMQLLHVEVPTGHLESGQRGPDLLSLACQAAAVLAQLPEPHTAVIADCFAICNALAEGIPGRVAAEMLSLCGISPTQTAAAASQAASGQLVDAPLLRCVLAAEAAGGRYPATQSFLRLLTTLLSAASPTAALQVLVVWVLHRVVAEHHTWRYCLRAERWRLAGLCLRLVRYSLQSAPTSPSIGPQPGQGGQAQGSVQATNGGSAIEAAVAGVLQYDAAMAACLLTALPYHAEQLERSGAEGRGEDEVAAAEDCCLQWHHLLPVLLPAGAPSARLAPAAFFRPCPTTAATAWGSGPGSDKPVAVSAAVVLLSYVSYPFFGSSQRALVMRSMHCLAAAAAAVAPGAVFAVLLPQGGPEAGVASAARGAIAAAFSADSVAATPALLMAACDVLMAAVQCHPSLLDALLFPCALEQALLEKENTSGNGVSALPSTAGGGTKSSKKGAGAPPSCLDALWGLLQQRERLQQEQPAVLAKLLQVLAAFWQSGGATFRAVAVLQRQSSLWGHLIGMLQAAGQAGRLQLPNVRAVNGSEAAAAAAALAAQDSLAALVSAEAFALQIVAAECYAWAADGAGSPPVELSSFLQQLPANLVPQLLERYCTTLPTASLLLGAQRAAAATGLQLLGVALSDETLWRSSAEGASLAPLLGAAAQPLLRQFGSNSDAARVLCEQAPQLAAANFPSRPAASSISRLILQQAEVPTRVAADREFGRGFVYDSQLLRQRLGGVLVHQLDELSDLSGWLEGASVAASLEDATLAAVTALKVLLSVVHKRRAAAPANTSSSGGGAMVASGKTTASTVEAALRELAEALWQLAAGPEDGGAAAAAAAQAAAVDPAGVHLCNAAEAAHILLLLAQRWALGAADEAAAVALTTGVLRTAGAWLEALAGGAVTGFSTSPDAQPAADAISHSLLATALVLLPVAPPAADDLGPPSETAVLLIRAATQLLPLLLAACHRQPPQLVLVVSLAADLIQRQVPASAWLPLVRSHLHFGDLLHSMLVSLHSAARQQRQRGGDQPPQPDAPRPMLLLPGGKAAPRGAAAGPGAGGAVQPPQAGSLGPLAAAGVEEAALLLALQVAQLKAGAELLVEQGIVAHILTLGKWLLAAEGGDLMAETPQPIGSGRASGGATTSAPAGSGTVVDYSNAYLQDGSPNPAHRLWCCVLSLLAALLAGLPGHAAVEQAALQLAVEAEPRLLLASEPPAASSQQPLSLAMAQESKVTLFFLCGLSRLNGEWRILLPDSLPAFRRATAAFLHFAASPGDGPFRCAPVSAAERAAARADTSLAGEAGRSHSSSSSDSFSLGRGWFGAVAAASDGAAGSGAAAAAAGGYAWQLAERLYSSAQYALAFQLALAPEVGEEELAELGPEWVSPATLLALQEGVLDVAEACVSDRRSASRRLGRTLQVLLGLSSQVQDGLGADRTHRHKLAVLAAINQLGAAPGDRRLN